MDLKRFLVSVPIALILTLAGSAMGPGPQLVGVAVQVAGVVEPAAEFAPQHLRITAETPEPGNSPVSVPTSTPTLAPTPTVSFTPTPTRDPNRRTIRMPILMYHYVSVPPPDADKYRLDLSVTPANFQAQMEYLAAEGYHPIRLSDLADYLRNGKPLPANPIALTFDDGYADNYQNAFPVLKEYKFPATFFVITQFVDDKKPGYMTWDQLEEMAIEGMEIGSHTMTHIDLKGKTRSVQASELAGSKAMIEARIGTPVKSFGYPAGKYDSQTLAVVRSIGYTSAVSTDVQGTRQSTDTIFELRRVRIRGNYSLGDFAYWIKYFLSNSK